MTDKFEEWLLKMAARYPAKTLDERQESDEHFEAGLNVAYSEALSKYREFLKESEIKEQQEKDEHECKLKKMEEK